MKIEDREVNSIEEAFSLLPRELQAHCRRVSQYCDVALKQAVKKDMHLDTATGQTQLTAENTWIAAVSGLYHDIGKLLPDEEERFFDEDAPKETEKKEVELDEFGEEIARPDEGPKDHTGHGAAIFMQLYPDFTQLAYVERTMLLDGIKDHHERLNGLGGPEGKRGDAISYMGRLVAIADLLDHHAMSLSSDDPIAEALENLKSDVKAGFLDEPFYKAFAASRAKLKKIWSSSMGGDIELPKTDQWIKRKVTRPMKLVYTTAHLCGTSEDDNKNYIWYADMRFKGDKEYDLKYADVQKTIVHNKLGTKLGQYFVYELCDAYKRFKDLKLDLSGAAMMLPAAFFSAKTMAKLIENAIADEGLDKNELYFIIPEDVTLRASKTSVTNIEECKELGIQIYEEYEFMGIADVEEGLEFETEETIEKDQIKALAQRALKEAQWDEELEKE